MRIELTFIEPQSIVLSLNSSSPYFTPFLLYGRDSWNRTNTKRVKVFCTCRYTISPYLLSGDAPSICLTFLVTGPLNTNRFKLLGWQELKDLNLYLTVLETEMLPLHQAPRSPYQL